MTLEREKERLVAKIDALAAGIYAQIQHGVTEREVNAYWEQALLLTRAYAAVDGASRGTTQSPYDWSFLDEFDVASLRVSTQFRHRVPRDEEVVGDSSVLAVNLTSPLERGVILAQAQPLGGGPGGGPGGPGGPAFAAAEDDGMDVWDALFKILSAAGISEGLMKPFQAALRGPAGKKLALFLRELWKAIKEGGKNRLLAVSSG